MIQIKQTIKLVNEQSCKGKSYSAKKLVTTYTFFGIPLFRSESILSHNA